ncbi:unnamed protein product [Parajaminaea phylloscopi]
MTTTDSQGRPRDTAAEAPAHPVPFVYRLVLGTIEPLLTVGGVFQLLVFPGSQLAITTPSLAHRFYPLVNGVRVHTDDADLLQTLLWQIAGGWVMLTLLEVLLLHYLRPHDLGLWRGLHCCVLLGSDLCYIVALALGLPEKGAPPLAWVTNAGAWATIILTILPLSARLGLVLGIGLGDGENRSGLQKRAKHQ